MTGFDRLQILGAYGLERTKTFPTITHFNRDGRHTGLTFGDTNGLNSWVLTYDVLNDDSQCPVTIDDSGATQTPFDYYREFFDTHAATKLPFEIQCPEDDKIYTVIFAENARKLTYRTFNVWAASGGVPLIQWRGQDDVQLEGAASFPVDTI